MDLHYLLSKDSAYRITLPPIFNDNPQQYIDFIDGEYPHQSPWTIELAGETKTKNNEYLELFL